MPCVVGRKKGNGVECGGTLHVSLRLCAESGGRAGLAVAGIAAAACRLRHWSKPGRQGLPNGECQCERERCGLLAGKSRYAAGRRRPAVSLGARQSLFFCLARVRAGSCRPIFRILSLRIHGRPVAVPGPSFREIKEDERFCDSFLVKPRMLRMDGLEIMPSEYARIRC